MSSTPASRRIVLKSFLQTGFALASANSIAGATVDVQDEQKSENHVPPKFNSDETIAYWPGNSIICHIDKKSSAFIALLDIHRRLSHDGVLHRVAVLPPASYHMTVFNGISYPERQKHFPTDIPRDASEEFCNQWFFEKLEKFDLGCELPFRMRAMPLALQTNPYNILLEPIDAVEDKKIRTLRDRLAKVLSYRLADHDTYQFHITLNYFYSKMDRDEEQRHFKLHQELVSEFLARAPVIELHNPEYVYFDDMYEFRPQLLLRNRLKTG
jgi:hypothetical protein